MLILTATYAEFYLITGFRCQLRRPTHTLRLQQRRGREENGEKNQRSGKLRPFRPKWKFESCTGPGMAGCVGYELVLMEVFTTTFGRRWSCAGGSLSLPYSRRVHFLCCASPFSHFLAIPALFEETGLWKYLLTQSSQMLSLSILSVG